jgi:hypothetical protein
VVAISLVAFCYIGSFFIIRYAFLRPYERRHLDQHWMRPAYNKLYPVLRWLCANNWSPVSPPVEVVSGRVISISNRNVTLDITNGMESVGFVANADVLRTTETISAGDYVEVGLGVALFDNHDVFMNRLLYIRRIQP